MQVPPGLAHKKDHVCLLHKYGLKQASRQWYAKLSDFLISHGYKHATTDHSLFIKFSHSKITALLVYVDDVVLTGNDLDEISNITSLLHDTFKIKNLGDLTYFLGFKVARSVTGINLSQRKYTLDLLKDTGMLDSAPVSTPMHVSKHKVVENTDILPDPTPYR